MVKFDAKPIPLVIIQVYAPTTEYSEDCLEEFYKDMREAMDQTKTTDLVIVMGDLNAKVGKGKDGEIVGPYGLGTRNERGDRLIEFCEEYNLSISNTQFQHHPRYLYTWKSPGDVRRNQIDYIMIKQRFKNSIINVKTLPGADINSDHCLLAAKIKLKLKVPKQSKVQAQYDLNTLKPFLKER